jgi:hypothetical protein
MKKEKKDRKRETQEGLDKRGGRGTRKDGHLIFSLVAQKKKAGDHTATPKHQSTPLFPHNPAFSSGDQFLLA